MIRSIGITLALIAGSATAGEYMDCYNDGTDADIRYTSVEPEVLRVSDAEIAAMLTRIRAAESRTVAVAEDDPFLQASLSNGTTASR